ASTSWDRSGPSDRSDRKTGRPLPGGAVSTASTVQPASASWASSSVKPTTSGGWFSRACATPSDLHNLPLLGLQQLVHFRNVAVGQFLDAFLGPPGVVFRQFPVLLGLADRFDDVSTGVAHRDPLLLRHLTHDAHQFLTP